MTKLKMMMKWHEADEANTDYLNELRKRISRGENQVLEFKRKVSAPEKIISEMIAFANSGGGTLFIGVADDRTIPGIKFPDEEIFQIEESLRILCRPALKYRTRIMPVAAQRYVVEFDIPESRRKPHVLVTPAGRREVYVRYEDKTVQASSELKQIIRRTRKLRNIKFRYGKDEEVLMKYLDQHAFISLDTYRNITGLNRYRASQNLIRLVLANVLQITPTEKGDRYSLHHAF